MAAIIKIENLYKVYSVGKEKVVALGGINLQIEKGQICCILGTSGSGKSTLLNQLAGLEKPSKGRVLIGGVNISTLNEGQLAKFRQKNIGFIFQSYNLLQSYSALENVAMPLMFRGIPKALRNRRAKMILKQVGLDKRMSHKPAQMSGGQQQRVGIARAFVSKPKIVFADEPTGNLDTRTTKEVMELMVRLCRQEQSDAGAGYSRPRAGAVCRPHHHTDRRQGGGRPPESVDCAGGSRRGSAAGAGGGSARFCHPNPRQRKAGREQHKNQHRAGGKRAAADQLQKAAPTEQQTVQPQKTEREDGE